MFRLIFSLIILLITFNSSFQFGNTQYYSSHLKDEQLPIKLLENSLFSNESHLINQSNKLRIVGGHEAIPHAYPYTIGLSILKLSGHFIWCGGSLITNQYILTAAHCLKNAFNIIIYLGCHNIKDINCPKIQINEENIILHEDFIEETFQNDIAIIQLPKNITLNDNIQIIQLPKINQTEQTQLEGRIVTTTGWGFYQDGNPLISNYLRVIDVTIMNQDQCRERYLNIPKDSNVCIDGSNGKSTCDGDSGGPLIYTDYYNHSKHKILIGLTSFGALAGCEKGWPAVFTRITSYLEWIQQHTGIIY